jgi:LCP family protein required for cell wall assembly
MSYGHQQGPPRRRPGPDNGQGRQPGYGGPPPSRTPAYHQARKMELPRTGNPAQDYRQPPPRRQPQPPPDDFGPPPERQGDGYPPPPPRRRPPRKRRWGRKLGIAFLIILVVFGGVWIWLDSSLNRVAALTDYPGRPAAGEGTNWLIVGSDSRADLTAEEQAELSTGAPTSKLTDTMMLLHIPDSDAKPTLVSLMRDTAVTLPGEDDRVKLNSVHAKGGPQLLVQVIELKTGLRMDHYVEVGLGGFAGVVDAVGGVEMCLDQPMNDPLAGVNLPAGCQELNGAQALGYVRSRATPRADYDRVVHQREFIGALTDKIASPGTILNPFKLFPVLANAPDAITVDEGDHLHHLPSLAFAMSGASDGSTVSTTVPIGGSSGSMLEWHEDRAPMLFDALRTDAEVPPEAIETGP